MYRNKTIFNLILGTPLIYLNLFCTGLFTRQLLCYVKKIYNKNISHYIYDKIKKKL